MAKPELAKLGAFETSVRRATRVRWPASGGLGAEDRIDFEPGPGDLLELRHAPSRRFLGREPTHESLLIELAQPLPDAGPSVLRFTRVVYRAGTDRLAYQATRAMGTLTLIQVTPERHIIDASLTLVAELDVEGIGTRSLAGEVVIERR
jgi:hypothetical protein